ncbi:MAG: GNAT family N-acetyltransferase [Mycobacteriales bacterium]
MAEVRLRPFAERDVPDLLEAWRDETQRLWWGVGATDAAGAREWIAKRNDWSSGVARAWAITDDTGRLLGNVNLHAIDRDQGEAQVGYWVAPWGRGRGVATAAVRLVVTLGFEELELHRVMLYHAVENIASCGVARRAGFRLEATTKLSHRFGDGEYHDEHLHAVLADEWNA